MNDNTFMKEKKFPGLVLSMSLPMVLSMLVNSLYNIVDSYFVAGIQEEAMTALSLVFPIQNLLNAIAIGFGIGINAAIAFFSGGRAEGAGGSGGVRRLFHQCGAEPDSDGSLYAGDAWIPAVIFEGSGGYRLCAALFPDCLCFCGDPFLQSEL